MKRQMGVRLGAVAVVAVALLVVAACGSSSKSSGGATSGTLKIGFIGALTGSTAQLGINIRNGQQLAINQYMASNPKVKVASEPFDSQGAAAQATTGATKLVQSGDVAVIGPTFSGESEAANPILNKAQIPFVSASATAVDLANRGWTYFHRIVGADNAQGPAGANYLVKTLGKKNVAVVDDSSSYGLPLGNYVRNQVKAAGGTVVVSDHVDPNGQDYSATVNKVQGAKADATYYAGYYDAAGRLIKQLRAAGFNGTFMSDDGSEDSHFITDAGGAPAEGAYLTCPCADSTVLPQGRAFTAAYQQAFGVPPAIYSAEGYDATNFLLAAIKSGKTSPSAINSYLKSTTYPGITKTIKFEPNGNISPGTIFIYQVKNGRIVQIGSSAP